MLDDRVRHRAARDKATTARGARNLDLLAEPILKQRKRRAPHMDARAVRTAAGCDPLDPRAELCAPLRANANVQLQGFQ